MIQLILDGRTVSARKGEFLLAVARREGVSVPTLCHHEAVEPAGTCRMCMVEITRPEWDGWSKLVTSCLYPAQDGLVVSTRSARVMALRKEILQLWMARSPNATALHELAREYGADPNAYKATPEGDNCILCGLCTRICSTLVTGAIARMHRGVHKKVDTPFGEPSAVCIGCLACVRNCPTKAISCVENQQTIQVWNKTFVKVSCTRCGVPTIPEEHAAWLAERTGRPIEEFYVCEACKIAETAVGSRSLAW